MKASCKQLMTTQLSSKTILLSLPVLAALFVVSIGVSDVFANEVTFRPGDTIIIEAETQGWAVFNGEAHPSTIFLDGTATMNQNHKWQIETDAFVDYYSGTGEAVLKGNANDGQISLTGVGQSDDGISFRLILRGDYAPIHDQHGLFALDWSFATIYVPQNGISIPLLQNGIIELVHS